MTEQTLHDLDLRPLFAAGKEPFAAIMAAVEALAPGSGLRVIAPFRPVPLFTVMAKRGFEAQEQALDGGDWQITFLPIAPAPNPAPKPGPNSGPKPGPSPVHGSAEEAMLWPDPTQFLDLEGMTPALALPRLLDALDKMRPGEVLFAALEPDDTAWQQFPQLEALGHEWTGNLSADGLVLRLMVRRGLAKGETGF